MSATLTMDAEPAVAAIERLSAEPLFAFLAARGTRWLPWAGPGPGICNGSALTA
jgi:hypothetical protein